MFEESWGRSLESVIYDEICLLSETKDLCFCDVLCIVPRVNKEWY